uniref:Zeaxanthin epoxidase n=1 Tax=Gladiolus x hybridus TaxID=1769200 RepID=A0A161HR49_9ASPA|nr:zeaxanthin epoxidase [Gladiolus x hybridus]
MEQVQDIVIVGGGLAGLSAALGLHRKGIKSLVLESSDSLRSAGFAFTTWTNAWRALDALGIGDILRHRHLRLLRGTASSSSSGAVTSNLMLTEEGKLGEHEIRCVRRNILLETMEKELPQGTIRYSSKVVSIEEEGQLKLLHLADGSILKTKVLVGCDGVNSVIAKSLGLKKPSFSGRLASRGFATFPDGHGFKPDFAQYMGHGFRAGVLPCDEKDIYWFFTWTPNAQEKEVEQNALQTKEFLLRKLSMAEVPKEVIQVVEKSEMGIPFSSPLRFRSPWDLIWGIISKGNVCIAGDALHSMTPDLGQGGCSALEDGVVLARCLGDALLEREGAKGEYERITEALSKYASMRRWRSFELVTTALILGIIQQSDGAIMSFLRDKCLASILARRYLKAADYDCGKL